MAGGGSSEEENYWPGYVDALTTMTMVLTFIMMILGVVIFSMSENVSKQLVQQIAEAAKIEIKGGGTAEQVKDQVIAAIKSSKTTRTEKEDVSDSQDVTQHNMRGDNYAMPAPSTTPSAKTKLPSPTQADQSDTGKMAGLASSEQPKASESDSRKMAPPSSPIEKDPSKSEPDKRVDSNLTNETPEKASGITITDGGALMTIAFKKRVVQLDEGAIGDLNKAIETSIPMKSAMKLEIKGYADVSVLGVTEARRIAYYRAMLIRKQMLTAGFPADKLTVRLEDAPAADGDLVRVFAK